MDYERKVFYEVLKLLEVKPTDYKDDWEWRWFADILEIAQKYVDERISTETKSVQCARCNYWNCLDPVPIDLSDILEEYEC